MKILCTGDLHLGKSPTQLPETCDKDERLQPSYVLTRMVDYAIMEGVNMFLMSGDIIDQDNTFFESIGPLCKELKRLNDAGIDVYMIAGNHDWQVLPQALKVHGFEHVHLLGAKGNWERAEKEVNGFGVSIHGWSFPGRNFQSNPLKNFEASGPAALRIGLLHCDLDKANSDYGPVSRASLSSTDVDVWVLGHIHAPQLIDVGSNRFILYPGTPQPRDPKENGLRGPYLIIREDDGRITIDGPLPLSTVRYENVPVNVPADLDDESLETRIAMEAQEMKTQIAAEIGGENAEGMKLFLRMFLFGETNAYDQVSKTREIVDLEVDSGVYVSSIYNRTSPMLNLEEHAERNDAVGELARFLMSLRDEEHAEDHLLFRRIRDGFNGKSWKSIIGTPPSTLSLARYEEDIKESVERQVKVLIRKLLDSQEA